MVWTAGGIYEDKSIPTVHKAGGRDGLRTWDLCLSKPKGWTPKALYLWDALSSKYLQIIEEMYINEKICDREKWTQGVKWLSMVIYN